MNKLHLFLSTLFFTGMARSQNVGIGTTTPLQKLHVEGTSFFNGNMGIGANTPAFPLSFGPAIGDKISLWSNSTNSYGFGIQSSLLQIHTDISDADIAFGYGSSAAFTEAMRIKGNGSIGIGTIAPLQKLHVEGNGFFNGNIGIGTSDPFAGLTFNNTGGEKISLYGNATNNFGLGISPGILQIHSDIDFADIAFGYGSSSNFTERARIINTGIDGMTLKGRLHIKNGSNPLDLNSTGGVWLYKSDNSAQLAFMGTHNNTNIGFYGGSGGWGFVYDAINSRVGIGTTNPSDKLHVVGSTSLNGSVGIGVSSPGGSLRVVGSTILDGTVGIGTAGGTYNLEVNGTAAKSGGGSWAATSDARMKENVIPYTDGLSTLLKINPVKYHYNELSGYDKKPEYIGVVAQELQSIAPYMVGSFTKKGETYFNVDNSAMTYMLINAIKEQQKQIDELKKLVERSVKL